jgi:sugar (pentulose or hexulose) kinase
MDYVLGIDVGTSGTKAVLFDKRGKIVNQGYYGYKLYSEGKNIEQDADDWWKGCVEAVHQAVTGADVSKIAAIGLSTQGASMAALDSAGKPIGRAFTWLDGRSQAEADKLAALVGDETIYHTCGWKVSPSSDSAGILYMKTHKGYEDAVLYPSTLEYINLKLTGKPVVDPTNAAIRGLYNINTGVWDQKILDAVGVTEKELPVIMQTGAYVGTLCAQAADTLGLGSSVKVYNGAHDQYCASLGCGAVQAGDMLVSTGTSWVIMGISKAPVFSQSYISPCQHPAGKLYGNMMALPNSGTSYQWMADRFFPGIKLSHIDMQVASLQKNEELFFIPWLTGASYPHRNSNARGGFLGMDTSSGPCDMALAVMESAVFSLKISIDDFRTNGFNPALIKIMGGAAKSELWMDILAAVIDLPICKMRVTDSCALGAAFIAACGEGWYPDYAAAAKVATETENIGETKQDKNYYQEKYCRYREVLAGVATLY